MYFLQVKSRIFCYTGTHISDEGLQQNDYKYFHQIVYSIKTITKCEFFKNYWERLNVTSHPLEIADRWRDLNIRSNENN